MENSVYPKRVLQIVSSMDRGGAETLIMNVYRNIDRSKIQFDFITHSTKKGDFDDEITSLGGMVYKISSLGEVGPFRYIKELTKIISLNDYIAIHSHTDYQSGFPALAAKLCRIRKRVCHSHSNNWPKGTKLKDCLTLKLLRIFIQLFATDYCSCSIEAAKFLFGKGMVKRGKINVIKNGIDINSFLCVDECRESVLEELGFEKDVKVIGHVGRFSESKNHLFILKVLKELLNADPNYKAVLIGEGPLKKEIEREAERLELTNNIRFLGVRKDIPRLMKAFDVFLFPSLFEGFGIVTLEAQCVGTPCIVSDRVPKTIDMNLDLISFYSLEDDIRNWITGIKNAASLRRPENEIIKYEFTKNGYNILDSSSEWVSMYKRDSDKKSKLFELLVRG